jgi:hypothetical protein
MNIAGTTTIVVLPQLNNTLTVGGIETIQTQLMQLV